MRINKCLLREQLDELVVVIEGQSTVGKIYLTAIAVLSFKSDNISVGRNIKIIIEITV